MKKVRSYSSIWAVEKIIYSLDNKTMLPIPVTVSQAGWFVVTLLAMVLLKRTPPFSLIDNMLIQYGAIPFGVAWFMNQKNFDGKKPYNFLKSVILYLFRPKVTFAGKAVKPKKERQTDAITAVRSEIYHALPD